MKNVYFSIPINLGWDTALDYISLIEDDFYVDYWKRNTKYINNCVDRCDIFILLTNNNDFNININHLPIGCKIELEKAIKLNKQIFLGYQNRIIKSFYSVDIKNNILKGIPGTTDNIFNINSNNIQLNENNTLYDLSKNLLFFI